MRLRNPTLRENYRNAVSQLKEKGVFVSLKSVSDELEVPFDTARTFFYRNPRLAKELGLATRRDNKTFYDYVEAAKILDRSQSKINFFKSFSNNFRTKLNSFFYSCRQD